MALVVLHVLIQVGLILRVLLRPRREPASRLAWIMVIIVVPMLGMIAYVLFGEVNIGRRRIERMRQVLKQLEKTTSEAPPGAPDKIAEMPRHFAPLFTLGHSISGFPAVGSNSGRLLPDSNATIDAMVADIDAATDHVHLMFYIWLPDNNGCKMVEALKRAAARGVTCRILVDDLGSRRLIRSRHWADMRRAGVRLAQALPIGQLVVRVLRGRIDLRNHRKILVVDGRITYCGSQNCADPEFRIKAAYGPWVDAMIRFEGPIARQNQILFAGDWMAHVDEDIGDLLTRSVPAASPGFVAQAIGTGPTVRPSAMPEMFESLMYCARRELIATTPYYVPDEAMQAALCASARRGVATTIVFPARNDSRIVGAASRSYYQDLLGAGVRIFEYQGGLLHTKSLTVDGEITLIGSANMDRRSFELNYENNILFYDPALTADVRRRQESYIAGSHAISLQAVAAWSWPIQLWNNAVAMFGPVL
jgi:cardiolipin synthase